MARRCTHGGPDVELREEIWFFHFTVRVVMLDGEVQRATVRPGLPEANASVAGLVHEGDPIPAIGIEVFEIKAVRSNLMAQSVNFCRSPSDIKKDSSQ